MIDDNDADQMFLFSLFTDGPVGIIFCILAIVFMVYACQNKEDCSKLHCDNGKTPKLMEHACLCVEEAK